MLFYHDIDAKLMIFICRMWSSQGTGDALHPFTLEFEFIHLVAIARATYRLCFSASRMPVDATSAPQNSSAREACAEGPTWLHEEVEEYKLMPLKPSQFALRELDAFT